MGIFRQIYTALYWIRFENQEDFPYYKIDTNQIDIKKIYRNMRTFYLWLRHKIRKINGTNF